MLVAVPAVESGGKYYMSPHFGMAAKFVIAKAEAGRYEIVEVLQNPHPPGQEGGGRGRAVVEMLKARGVQAVVALSVGHGAYRHLQAAGIEVYYYPPRRGLIPIEEALQALLQGKLEKAQGPRELE